MTTTDALNRAIKIGEESTRLAIRYTLAIRDLRLAISLALSQLEQGQPDKARRTLEKALRNAATAGS